MEHVCFEKGQHGLAHVDIYPPGEYPAHGGDLVAYKAPLLARTERSERPDFKHYLCIYDANDETVADGFTTHKNPAKALRFLLDLALLSTQGEVK
jgi:hypothetical protein